MVTLEAGVYSNKKIRMAIMEEIGTDERTIEVTIKKMVELKMLEATGLGFMKINEEHTQE